MVFTTEKQTTKAAGPRRAAVTPAKRKRKINLVPYGFLSPTILLIVVLMLIPIVMVIWYSLMDNVITKKNPKFVGFSNYAEVLGSEGFRTAILNTVFFTTVSVAAHLVLGLIFAMLLNTRFLKSFTKAIFRVIYVMPWLFTVAIIAILWRLLLSPNGIVNFLVMELGLSSTSIEWLASRDTALLAVTFINIWAGYPFFMVSLLAGLQGIPKDLYEAARVDGANPVQQFMNITLPQLRPIIISMALLDLIWTSQQFALIWMTTGGGPINSTEMLSTFTYKLAFSEYNFSMAAASAVVILAFSMVLAFFYVRYQKARD